MTKENLNNSSFIKLYQKHLELGERGLVFLGEKNAKEPFISSHLWNSQETLFLLNSLKRIPHTSVGPGKIYQINKEGRNLDRKNRSASTFHLAGKDLGYMQRSNQIFYTEKKKINKCGKLYPLYARILIG